MSCAGASRRGLALEVHEGADGRSTLWQGARWMNALAYVGDSAALTTTGLESS